MPSSNNTSLDFSKVDFFPVYIFIYLVFNSLHHFPLCCDHDQLPQIVSSSCITYHPIMDLIWWINESSFNVWVIISSGLLVGSILIMDILKLTTYTRKWWYFTLICFPWPRGRSSRQCQHPVIIFKHFTQDSWWNCSNIIPQVLHLF